MTRGQTGFVAVALVALTALLVGFQSVSTLLTVTQLGASQPAESVKQPKLPAQPPPMAALAKPAKLAPEPVVLTKPPELAPAPVAIPAPRAREPAPAQPAPAASAAFDPTPIPTVPDNSTAIAAAAKVQARAERRAIRSQRIEETAPSREVRRRYRAPPPELHRVY